jgi:flagellar hook-basal body complex protein FliE
MAVPAISSLGIGTVAATPAGASTGAASKDEGTSSFADALKQLVDDAEQSAGHANTAVSGMLDKSVDVHDAMIALQRADMSLQLAVQIRNKLVQAYQDIMRMPV